jgi:hypothetical protein
MESKFQRQHSAATCKKPHRRQGKSNNNIAHAREMLIFYLIYTKPYSPPYSRAAFGLVVRQ